MSNYRKYSIEERMEYYNKIPFGSGSREKFALGYYFYLRHGRVLTNSSGYVDPNVVRGANAAKKALEKSRKIKF